MYLLLTEQYHRQSSRKKFAVLDDSGYVRAGETGETALEGLYVAGDARTKKLRQVVTAVSDGANAATAVAEYLK